MLNAVLTVRAREANSHKDRGWERVTDATIAHLNKHRDGLVFVLWGAYAQKKGAKIDQVGTVCSRDYTVVETLNILNLDKIVFLFRKNIDNV